MTSKKRALIRVKNQGGLGLVETLVAVAILGTAVVAFATALSAGSIAVGENDVEALSQGLAQSQLEYTKSYAYNPGAVTYPLLAAPAGYSVSLAVSAVPNTDADIQKITVTVDHGGQEMIKVEDYKVNR
jgi:Tfp pilus assembly protein PilV